MLAEKGLYEGKEKGVGLPSLLEGKKKKPFSTCHKKAFGKGKKKPLYQGNR